MILTPDRILKARQYLEISISKEWIDQGHNASGKTLDELEIVYVEENGKAIFRGMGSKVMAIHDKGVKASKINITWPHWRKVGYDWAKIVIPSLTDTGVYRFLRAVWNKWQKEGMPTSGSYKHSKNGRRTGWTEAAVFSQMRQDELEQLLNLGPLLEDQLLRGLEGLFAA